MWVRSQCGDLVNLNNAEEVNATPEGSVLAGFLMGTNGDDDRGHWGSMPLATDMTEEGAGFLLRELFIALADHDEVFDVIQYKQHHPEWWLPAPDEVTK